jgi:hypothetical protein
VCLQVGRVDHDRFRYGFRCREPLHHAQEDTPLAPPLPMRSLDDIDWYEVTKGHLYEVWSDNAFLGEVEVLSRATAAPRVYGSHLMIARSEYEGWVAASDARFKTNDIHAAVRELARRAQSANAVSTT